MKVRGGGVHKRCKKNLRYLGAFVIKNNYILIFVFMSVKLNIKACDY